MEQQNANTTFDGIGADVLTSVEVMSELGMSAMDLAFPEKFERFKDVVEYLKDQPDRSHFISKAVAGKDVNRLDHLWGYVTLNKNRDALMNQLKKLDEEIGGAATSKSCINLKTNPGADVSAYIVGTSWVIASGQCK